MGAKRRRLVAQLLTESLMMAVLSGLAGVALAFVFQGLLTRLLPMSQLGIERGAAQEYVDRYFQRYPGVKDFMERTRTQAREQGYVETVFGRRLYLPEINARSGQRRAAAERTLMAWIRTCLSLISFGFGLDKIIAANPDKVEQAKAKPSLAGWFVGQVMKATGGKANPQAVQALVRSKLGIED